MSVSPAGALTLTQIQMKMKTKYTVNQNRNQYKINNKAKNNGGGEEGEEEHEEQQEQQREQQQPYEYEYQAHGLKPVGRVRVLVEYTSGQSHSIAYFVHPGKVVVSQGKSIQRKQKQIGGGTKAPTHLR